MDSRLVGRSRSAGTRIGGGQVRAVPRALVAAALLPVSSTCQSSRAGGLSACCCDIRRGCGKGGNMNGIRSMRLRASSSPVLIVAVGFSCSFGGPRTRGASPATGNARMC